MFLKPKNTPRNPKLEFGGGGRDESSWNLKFVLPNPLALVPWFLKKMEVLTCLICFYGEIRERKRNEEEEDEERKREREDPKNEWKINEQGPIWLAI